MVMETCSSDLLPILVMLVTAVALIGTGMVFSQQVRE